MYCSEVETGAEEQDSVFPEGFDDGRRRSIQLIVSIT